MTVHPVIAALRAERRRRGWSQTDIARQIGCDPATISNCERGQRSPGFMLLTAWAVALDRQIIAVPVLWDQPT